MYFFTKNASRLLQLTAARQPSQKDRICYKASEYTCRFVDDLGAFLTECLARGRLSSLDIIILQVGGQTGALNYETLNEKLQNMGQTLQIQAHFLCPVRDILRPQNASVTSASLSDLYLYSVELSKALETAVNFRLVVNFPNEQQLRVYVLNLLELEAFPSALNVPGVEYVLHSCGIDSFGLDHLFQLLRAADQTGFAQSSSDRQLFRQLQNDKSSHQRELLDVKQKCSQAELRESQQREEIERLSRQIGELKGNLRLKQSKLEHYKQLEDHQASRENLIKIEVESENAQLRAENGKLARENMHLIAENQRLSEKFKLMEDQAVWMERQCNDQRKALDELQRRYGQLEALKK